MTTAVLPPLIPSLQHQRRLRPNRLREIRTEHNLTQQGLAEQVDVSRQTIIALEKKQYNPSTLLALRIAQVFQVTVEEIFWLEPQEGV